MIYKTLCGKFTEKDTCGSSHYLGNSWGEEYNQELVHCPFLIDCGYKTEFQNKYPAFKLHNVTCTCYKTDEQYDYENSLEKQEDLYEEMQNDYVKEKFGDWCMAIRRERFGKVIVKKTIENCSACWNPICLITKKPRDIEKTNICLDKELLIKTGFIEEYKIIKGIKLNNSPIPKEVADQIIKNPQYWAGTYAMNESSKTDNDNSGERNYEIIKLKYYAKRSGAKRDILEDLTDIKEGKTVVHDSDIKKRTAGLKKEHRAECAARKKRGVSKINKQEEKGQVDIWDLI